LKQLTDGPYHDVSPCQLSCGDLVFVSTRRFGYTVCQPGPSSNLHRMSADGDRVRCVSMNTLSDMSPQMLPDGRVLFTRWEYIDRDLTYRQSLWTQAPNGTQYSLFFGNTIRDVGTFWQARPLPGRNDRLVATFAPHHGFPHGAIGLIDRQAGPEGARDEGFVYVTHEFPEIGDRSYEWAYRDPFPLGDRRFLCAYGGGGAERYRIYLLDADDQKRLVHEDPNFSCYYPLPLRPAAAPAWIPDQTEAAMQLPEHATQSPLGTVLLTDVYQGLQPTIRRGQVKQLRVMEQVRKTEDLAQRAYDQSPVMSYGTYYAKRDWGTVPVEEDGSAHFFVPALREIYLQVLDDEGRELQRMTSALQLMPGETLGCVGCHEPRQTTPPNSALLPLAARHPPRHLERPPWSQNALVDFPSVVQPVLDKYCIECHHGADPAGGYDLSGDKTRLFNMAYDNLLGRSRSYRQHDMAQGAMLPAEQAREKPLVHFYWLLRTPTAVNQPLWTGSHASRLLEYLEGDHCGQQVPSEDRRRIYLWIDANVPYYGTYAHSRPRSPGKRDLATDVATGRPAAWFADDFLGVYERRCAECHGKYPDPNDHAAIWDGRLAWINFTHPAWSPALTAHLAKAAGGRGIAMQRDGGDASLLPNTDPDYQTMLRAIQVGKRLADETPEADMPGFRGARPEP
jgi:mono/diheme cytochrome c family protein